MAINGIESGSTVEFRLSQAVCPEYEQIREKITSELNVRGKVVFLSDSGEKKGHFAIIEVGGIVSPLVVPADEVLLIERGGDDDRAGMTG